METSVIYDDNLDLLRKGARWIVNQGGQYSGKTVNILAALATLCSEEVGGGVTTVTSMSFPHLKGGALRDFEMFVYPEFKSSIRKYNKTEHIFYFKSGSILEFKVFENEIKARGQKRKRLFVNEGNSFDWMVFFQLDSRSDQTIIDYNPSIRFWCHENIIGKDGSYLLISDHRHNPFLNSSKHKEIENICTFAKNVDGSIMRHKSGEPIILSGDYELWKVYARGVTGNITGIIFPNWEMIDVNDFPEESDFIFGIDYGYTNDPTAIVKIAKIGNTLFVKEIAYETGLSPEQIKAILRANGFNAYTPLYSEHDPDMIKALRKVGLQNVFPARKGQGSVNAGIALLKTMTVKYTNDSKNLHRERGQYVWEKEKDTGRSTNIPVDKNNHAIDSIRYPVYTRYLKAA